MSNEANQTFVAWCPHHGVPLHEAHSADGWSWCRDCEKLYRIIIKDGKVTVVEDDKTTYEQSAILRWRMGVLYAARQRLNRRGVERTMSKTLNCR